MRRQNYASARALIITRLFALANRTPDNQCKLTDLSLSQARNAMCKRIPFPQSSSIDLCLRVRLKFMPRLGRVMHPDMARGLSSRRTEERARASAILSSALPDSPTPLHSWKLPSFLVANAIDLSQVAAMEPKPKIACWTCCGMARHWTRRFLTELPASALQTAAQ